MIENSTFKACLHGIFRCTIGLCRIEWLALLSIAGWGAITIFLARSLFQTYRLEREKKRKQTLLEAAYDARNGVLMGDVRIVKKR
ncbi:neuropeptide VF precursor [Perkinsela sp. CCAP 1560/4]|nr:neuropeptide VF precursor [Perkinsela sp. CCAP 1560/4]|eukprot:KNH05592.1 neuropeptide VF precursor [Perkinsela sp. CCAP 1560/4]